MGTEREHDIKQSVSVSSQIAEQEAINGVSLNTIPDNVGTIIQRAQKDPHSLSTNDFLHLQSTIGNRAVGQLISSAINGPGAILQKKPDTNHHNAYPYTHKVIQRVISKVGDLWLSDKTGQTYSTRAKAREADNKAANTSSSSEAAAAAAAPTKTKGVKRNRINEDDADAAEIEDEDMGTIPAAAAASSSAAADDSSSSASAAAPSDSKKKKKKKYEGASSAAAASASSSVAPRESRRQKTKVGDLPLHFDGPHYTPDANKKAGGKLSTALLGPNSKNGMNSDAVSNLPNAITSARSTRKQYNFKAGHLLNANFFGDGTSSSNLTILTASANTSMTAFDNNVKYAVDELKKLYQYLSDKFVDISDLKFGIHISVSVSDDKWGPKYPENCIANTITCIAILSGESQLVQKIESLPLLDSGEKDEKGKGAADNLVMNIKKFLAAAAVAKLIDNKANLG